jgi:hypothetical protein
MSLNALEKDCIMGTFTNKGEEPYLKYLRASVKNFLPEIPFVTISNSPYPINKNMSLLQNKFFESGKRYHVYFDDDIIILNSDIIKNALSLLVREKYGIVSVYSTFDKKVLESPYNPRGFGLTARDHNFAVGYFIMVDNKKVGNILPDLNLPDPNLAIDADFSIAVRATGYKIGISEDYVYHAQKDTHPGNPNSQPTIDYFFKKWGQYYFNYTQYGGSVIEWGTGKGSYT